MNNQEDDFLKQGYEDFVAGEDYEECPWDEGTDGEYGWKKGWKQAEKDIL
ncbi:MAG: hypothetical protein ABFD15_06600 [Methanofastidiosum sp.]